MSSYWNHCCVLWWKHFPPLVSFEMKTLKLAEPIAGMGIKYVASKSLGVIVTRATPFPSLDSQTYETWLWDKNHDILDIS